MGLGRRSLAEVSASLLLCVAALEEWKLDLEPDTKPEQLDLGGDHQLAVLRVLFVIAIPAGFAFAFVNAVRGVYGLAAAECVFSLSAILFLRKINTIKYTRLITMLFSIALILLIAYTLFQPNASPTMSAWVFTVPILAYSSLGERRGFYISAIFYLLIGGHFVFRYGDLEDFHSFAAVLNIGVCSLAVWGFVHAYEKARNESQLRLAHLAITDPLTGLNNRLGLETVFERRRVSSQQQGLVMGLVMMDLDFFKKINDTYGHDCGDEVLRRVASTLKSSVRSEDCVVRMGGEEFCLVVSRIGKLQLLRTAEAMRERIQNLEIEFAGERIRVTVSIGAVMMEEGVSSLDAMLSEADKRLYVAKNFGRNKVVFDGAEKLTVV